MIHCILGLQVMFGYYQGTGGVGGKANRTSGFRVDSTKLLLDEQLLAQLASNPQVSKGGKTCSHSAQENILVWLKVQQFSDGDLDPLDSACFKILDVK